MTDKEFKRLRRSDLIEIIYEQQKELEETKAELEKVKWAKAGKDIFAALESARIEIDCMEQEARRLQQEIAREQQVEPNTEQQADANIEQQVNSDTEQQVNSDAEQQAEPANEQQEDASRSTNKWIQRLRKKKQ